MGEHRLLERPECFERRRPPMRLGSQQQPEPAIIVDARSGLGNESAGLGREVRFYLLGSRHFGASGLGIGACGRELGTFCLLPGRASLVERNDGSGDGSGECECERDDGECDAEAFVLADSLGEAFALGALFGVALLLGGGEEFCFEGVEVVGVVLVPGEGLFEACAAVELSWVAVEAVP